MLDDLPFPSSVCFFTKHELDGLQIPQSSPLYSARSEQLRAISASYSGIKRALAAAAPGSASTEAALFPSGFSEKWFRWSYGVVMNSAIEIPQ
jgi:hypothetical protein